MDYCKPFIINYVGIKKTFDSIYHFTLWKIFKTCSIPETYIGIFQQLHTIPQCCFKTVSGTADYFKVEQDSSKMTLHHLFLFVIVDPLMRTPMSPTHCGIIWQERKLEDLDFADGLVLLTNKYN